MPTIFIEGFIFRFYSSDLNEPPHIHVIQDDKVAKIWLESLIVAHNYGYNRSTLNRIVRLTRQNKERLLEAWNAHFGN